MSLCPPIGAPIELSELFLDRRRSAFFRNHSLQPLATIVVSCREYAQEYSKDDNNRVFLETVGTLILMWQDIKTVGRRLHSRRRIPESFKSVSTGKRTIQRILPRDPLIFLETSACALHWPAKFLMAHFPS